MKLFESEHYLFHYGENTKAERDILKIAAHQEACYLYICSVIKVSPDFKIEYFLCNSPEEVGRIYGDNEPCNGFASMPNRIYAVYNEQVQCIGFHEDAHIISYTINRPDCPAIREGLAMYFDRKWWGIQNPDWVCYFLKTGRYIPVHQLLDKKTFFDTDCAVSYPIMGAFTEYLIAAYGIDTYLSFYRQNDVPSALEETFHKSASMLNQDFSEYVKLFHLDSVLENRICQLLNR